jgi:hypothetical protein
MKGGDMKNQICKWWKKGEKMECEITTVYSPSERVKF